MSEITLYDIPSKQGKAWSLNSWKTRLILNFKGIDYETNWIDYPDIEPTFAPHVPPNAPPDTTPYTIPTISLSSTSSPTGSSKYIMNSRAIAAHLEQLHPSPSLHLDSPILTKVYKIQSKHLEPLWGIWMPLVSQNLLNPRSKEYFDRTRQEDPDVGGLSLPEFLRKTEVRGDEVWKEAGVGFRMLGELLEERGGPFFMGSTVTYADLIVLGWLQFYKCIDEERLFDRVLKMESRLGTLYEAGKKWLARDDR